MRCLILSLLISSANAEVILPHDDVDQNIIGKIITKIMKPGKLGNGTHNGYGRRKPEGRDARRTRSRPFSDRREHTRLPR